MSAKPSGFLTVLISLMLLGCSGDSVKISTQSNAPATLPNGVGASVTVAASSADGSNTVVIGSPVQEAQAQANARYWYQTFVEEEHTFCLAGGRSGAVLELFDRNAQLQFAMREPGCSSVDLLPGDYYLEVEDAPGARVERLPGSEVLEGAGEGLLTLVTVD